jgi:hypothetical protein
VWCHCCVQRHQRVRFTGVYNVTRESDSLVCTTSPESEMVMLVLPFFAGTDLVAITDRYGYQLSGHTVLPVSSHQVIQCYLYQVIRSYSATCIKLSGHTVLPVSSGHTVVPVCFKLSGHTVLPVSSYQVIQSYLYQVTRSYSSTCIKLSSYQVIR